MKYEITIGDTTRAVTVVLVGPGRYRVSWPGESHEIDAIRPTPEAFQMLIDGESWETGCVPTSEGYLVDVRGINVPVEVVDPRRKVLRLSSGAEGGSVSSAMPGRVVRVLVKAGDPVWKGQPVVVVEAMKMENELKTPVAGVVGEVFVREGQAVEARARLVRVDPA